MKNKYIFEEEITDCNRSSFSQMKLWFRWLREKSVWCDLMQWDTLSRFLQMAFPILFSNHLLFHSVLPSNWHCEEHRTFQFLRSLIRSKIAFRMKQRRGATRHLHRHAFLRDFSCVYFLLNGSIEDSWNILSPWMVKELKFVDRSFSLALRNPRKSIFNHSGIVKSNYASDREENFIVL